MEISWRFSVTNKQWTDGLTFTHFLLTIKSSLFIEVPFDKKGMFLSLILNIHCKSTEFGLFVYVHVPHLYTNHQAPPESIPADKSQCCAYFIALRRGLHNTLQKHSSKMEWNECNCNHQYFLDDANDKPHFVQTLNWLYNLQYHFNKHEFTWQNSTEYNTMYNKIIYTVYLDLLLDQ